MYVDLDKFQWLHSILLHVCTAVHSGGFFLNVSALCHFFLFNAVVSTDVHTLCFVQLFS